MLRLLRMKMMSRIKDYFITDQEEEEILSPESYLNLDPEYLKWSEKLDEQFNREFQQDPEETKGSIPF